MEKKCHLYIGTAGWSYSDWGGIVYPKSAPKSFDQLRYLANFFNAIEINSSFYRPPAEKTVESWLRRISDVPDFQFTLKLWQRFTHERNSFPDAAERNLVTKSLKILKSGDRLGALLIQFPWSFKFTEENQNWLNRIIELFHDYFPVVELRHSSWLNERFFDFLKKNNVGFANIDQPVIGESIPLTSYVTSSVGYVRFHGRNAKAWFDNEATAASRYDYLYSMEELKAVREKIMLIIENSPKTFLIFNNHFRGQAVANALQLQYLFDEKKRDMPATLLREYPELNSMVGKPTSPDGQIFLFD